MGAPVLLLENDRLERRTGGHRVVIPLDAANRAGRVADVTLVAGSLVLVVVLQAPHVNCHTEYRLAAQLRHEIPRARGSFGVCEVGNGALGVVVKAL